MFHPLYRKRAAEETRVAVTNGDHNIEPKNSRVLGQDTEDQMQALNVSEKESTAYDTNTEGSAVSSKDEASPETPREHKVKSFLVIRSFPIALTYYIIFDTVKA